MPTLLIAHIGAVGCSGRPLVGAVAAVAHAVVHHHGTDTQRDVPFVRAEEDTLGGRGHSFIYFHSQLLLQLKYTITITYSVLLNKQYREF